MPIKSVKMKISKNKKMRFFLISQGSLNPKIRFLGQNVCSVAWLQTDRQTHRHTDTQTHTKVKTEDTLSGFQEYFLQPIIKDRSNNCMTCILQIDRHTNRQIHTETQNCEPLFWETLPSGYDQGAVQYICN